MTLNWESFSFDNYSQLETIPKWEWFSIAARSQLKKIKKSIDKWFGRALAPGILGGKVKHKFSTRIDTFVEIVRIFPQLDLSTVVRMILNYELLSTENDSQVGMNCQKIQNIKTLKKLLTF